MGPSGIPSNISSYIWHNRGVFFSITAVLFKCDIHSQSFPLTLSLSPAGVRLTADTVFKILKKTNKEWDRLARRILGISSSKCHEIAQRCSTTDDCLMESIKFWLKRCPHASYRWIVYNLNDEGMTDISKEMHHLLEPIQGKNEWEVLLTLVLVALTISLFY